MKTGRTTKILDQCVQILFKTGRCLVKDHEDGDNEALLNKLLLRLSFEHPTVKTHIKTTDSGLKIILLREPKAWSKLHKDFR